MIKRLNTIKKFFIRTQIRLCLIIRNRTDIVKTPLKDLKLLSEILNPTLFEEIATVASTNELFNTPFVNIGDVNDRITNITALYKQKKNVINFVCSLPAVRTNANSFFSSRNLYARPVDEIVVFRSNLLAYIAILQTGNDDPGMDGLNHRILARTTEQLVELTLALVKISLLN